MKRKIVGFLALFISVTMITTGCGGADSASTSSFATTETADYDAGGFDGNLEGSNYVDSYDESYAEEKSMEAESPEEPELDEDTEYDTSRKKVYRSHISIETKKFDDDIAAIRDFVQSNQGYYEDSAVSGSQEYGGRRASFTARIPAANYQKFMESIGDIGSVTSTSENVEDITSSYVDAQARLKSLRTKLKRLEELEQNAQTVEELLQIEDRINDVQYQIENYTAQLRVYDNQVDYCTISINVEEVVTYTEIKADTFWNRLTEAIGDSLSGFVSFLQGLVIVIVYVLPYAIGAVVIACIVLFILKKKGKTPKKLKEKKAGKAASITKTAGYTGPSYSEEDKKE
ncbi:protein of unknown function [Pseudobutyrivibrio sp. UC1225]|uniref:DUF4349 domain-containing protein n=1 Tax=Pseudobutyrivibrio sp. UC1225 TaxID=1798185 RepID=UPI0008E56802|nr:DUF4349 domain-containing protein [Pseudobutyrivibrio sp. UC1225]SFN53450.1 protein of unknown function [Pseudobutyrivibrio sp. UC1225]